MHLKTVYPDRPSLFNGAAAITVVQFVNARADRLLLPMVAALAIVEIHDHLHEKDRAYFRASRGKAFGRTLDDVMADRATRVVVFHKATEPLRAVLPSRPFIAGDTPAYADYIPVGALQWARAISACPLLESGDLVCAWRDRLLDAFDGLARSPPAY